MTGVKAVAVVEAKDFLTIASKEEPVKSVGEMNKEIKAAWMREQGLNK